MKNLHQSARRFGPSAAARALQPFVECVAGRPPSFAHARKLLHEHGMVQFAQGDRIHLDHGYCLDDNARALLAAILALRLDPELADARAVGDAGLAFVERCRRPDGRFHNLIAEDGSFADEIGSQDSFGRALWVCGIAARCAPLPDWRERCAVLLRGALKRAHDLTALRPRAYAILGLAAAVAPERASPVSGCADLPADLLGEAQEVLRSMCAALRAHFERHAEPQWDWWEPILTWGNARLPEAMLRSAAALSDPALERTGMRSLAFLAAVTQPREVFRPIGNAGWYERGKERAWHDQQPIEVCGMVDLWLAASKLTGRMEYRGKALEAFGWFFGSNSEGLVMVAADGGCRDGLGHGESNANMGAESTLSYLQAHAAFALSV